jgi:hypothetical protein
MRQKRRTRWFMSVDRGADTLRNDLTAGKLADIVAFPADARQNIRQVEKVFFVMRTAWSSGMTVPRSRTFRRPVSQIRRRLLQRAQLAQLFDLLAEDYRLNVYAGDLEVRHQVRPDRVFAWRRSHMQRSRTAELMRCCRCWSAIRRLFLQS